jgi:D-lactate dehydrogenase
MMGGILANNASGMCCGVQFNSYHTLQNIKVVLYNGYVLDTFDPNCEEKLKNDVPEIYEKVLEIKNQILNNPSLVDKIKKKYAIKNTIGYSLNAFIDFEKVSDIYRAFDDWIRRNIRLHRRSRIKNHSRPSF